MFCLTVQLSSHMGSNIIAFVKNFLTSSFVLLVWYKYAQIMQRNQKRNGLSFRYHMHYTRTIGFSPSRSVLLLLAIKTGCQTIKGLGGIHTSTIDVASKVEKAWYWFLGPGEKKRTWGLLEKEKNKYKPGHEARTIATHSPDIMTNSSSLVWHWRVHTSPQLVSSAVVFNSSCAGSLLKGSQTQRLVGGEKKKLKKTGKFRMVYKSTIPNGRRSGISRI